MKRLAILILLGILLPSTFSFGQAPLTDAQVIAAINSAFAGKRHQIGLTLNDLQTNLLSGLACKTCKTTGYTIFVYTPESWIELKAVQARREMLPFGLEDVTPEMRLPYIHVLASPSRPEYLNASGMAMASSVHRVVLSSTDRGDVVQPLSESHSAVESNSAFRSFAQASAGAVFSLEDVERLRSEDLKGEFFVIVVGDNKNKYFKVKTKFFNQLFGQPVDTKYATLKTTPSETMAAERPATKNTLVSSTTQTQVSKFQPPKDIESPAVPRSNREAKLGEYHHASEDEIPRAPVPAAQPRSSAISTNLDAVTVTQKPTTPLNKATRKADPKPYDGFAYDSALIARWWNFPEAGVKTSSESADPTSATDGARTAGVASTADQGSIGAWSDENPRIKRDGVKIDRMTPRGPAEQAGLQVGDDILALDGIYVFTVDELMETLHRCRPGTNISLRYRRRSIIYDTFVIIAPLEN